MKLTLIRHGITEGNAKRLYYGSTDIPLLPESFERLRRYAEAGRYPKAERYFTSGMIRTEQTFSAIYGDTPHEAIRDMREIDFGVFEMRPYEELKDDPEYQKWIEGDFESNVCPGGESGVQVTERALRAIRPLIEDGRDAVIVTHGGVIGGVLGKLFPRENARFYYTPEPGGGFTVEFENGIPVSIMKLGPSGEQNDN